MSQFCSLSVIKSINHPGRWWSPTVRREMWADSYKINMFFRKHLSRAGVEFSSDPTRITHTLIIIIIQVHYVPVRVIKLILTLQSILQRSNAFEHWSQCCYFCKKIRKSDASVAFLSQRMRSCRNQTLLLFRQKGRKVSSPHLYNRFSRKKLLRSINHPN